ncbi:MAG TPA: prepilin-type N-terminal cleavage/methylation domain-containing protein [Patescibacteria group bacterium]|nr:prepilin-type N-terminal cleavage/methylation domain-containing protein [Patescibacteria group bacterium]
MRSRTKVWKYKLSGYTLIEILVGLTIIGLLFGIGYVNFRDFSRRQAIAGAGKLIQGDLRIAQQLALVGQKPDQSCILTGYNFDVDSAARSYSIYALCETGPATEVTKTVTLPPGIQIAAPSPNPILFKVLGTGTNLTSGTADIVLTQDLTANQYTVTVGSGGEIR